MRNLQNKPFTGLKRMQIQVNTVTNEQVVIETMVNSTYFKTIKDIIDNPPAKGWNNMNLSLLRSRISLQKKIKDDSKKSVKIEENEYTALVEAVKDYGVMITSEEVLNFLEYIEKLPTEK